MFPVYFNFLQGIFLIMIFQGFLFAVNCSGSRTLSLSPWISQTAKINSITEIFWVNSFAAAKASLAFIKDRCRSNRSQMFFKMSVLKNFGMFTGKHLLESLFNQVTGLQVFSWEYCKIAKSSFFIEHHRWLLLQMFDIFSKRHCWIYCSFTLRNCFILKPKITLICFHLLHHSFSFVVPLVVAHCTTRCHSLFYLLSLVVPLVVIRCHSLSLVVSLVVTSCNLMYHTSVFS